MLLQETPYTCGPVALCNALAALGERHGQDDVAKLASASPIHGTSPKKLLRAIVRLGHGGEILQPIDARAWADLTRVLRAGSPVVLLVDRDEHWVAAIGVIGRSRVLVADSADGALVLSYSKPELLARWRGRSWKRPFYGVVVK